MKVGQTITCDECQEQLVALVYDELVPDERARVLAHLKSCPRCAADHAGLSAVAKAAAQFPVAEPPAGLREAILQRAVKTRDGRPKRAQRSVALELPWWRRVLERLGTLATSPQVAMASVLLLMVGVGLYALPRFGEPESEALSASRAAQATPAVAPAAQATSVPSPEEAAEEKRVARPMFEPEPAPFASEQAPARESEMNRARSAELDRSARSAKRKEVAPQGLGGLASQGYAPKGGAPSKSKPAPRAFDSALDDFGGGGVTAGEAVSGRYASGTGAAAAAPARAEEAADEAVGGFAPPPPAAPTASAAPAKAETPAPGSSDVLSAARAALSRGELEMAAKLARSVTPKSAPAVFAEAQRILAEVSLAQLRCSDAETQLRTAGSLDAASRARVADCRSTVALREASKKSAPAAAEPGN